MAAPIGRGLRTRFSERASPLRQIAGVQPARLRREIKAPHPPSALVIAAIGELPSLGARR